MQNAAKSTMDTELRLIPLKEIEPDPSQPRETFNTLELEELASSIKEVGIRQAIEIREITSGKTVSGALYRITFGERRFRAAGLAGLQKIPAMIRNVSEEEALQLQFIENLQREQVPIMEQASRIKKLLETRQVSLESAANHIGKSIYFVRRLLKLNSLIPKWQKIVAKDGLPIEVALELAILPENVQLHFYKESVSKEQEASKTPVIQLNTYMLSKQSGDLANAPFDVKDGNLDKKMGTCTGCPFNTSCGSLFPEQEKFPRCTNLSCFKNKAAIHISNELARVKTDPTTILVYDDYKPSQLVEQLRAEGLEVLRAGYGEACKEIQMPVKPVWEIHWERAKKRGINEKKAKEEFNNDLDTYKFQAESFSKKLATGKYHQAFMVSASSEKDCGRHLYIELTPKESSKPKRIEIQAGSSISDIDTELDRLKNRENRAQELDAEKVHKMIVDAVKADPTLRKVPIKVENTETYILYFLLLEHLSYYSIGDLKKNIKITELWQPKDGPSYIKALQSLTRQQAVYIARHIMVEKYSNQLPKTGGGFMLRLMAECMKTIPIADFEKSQAEIAKKRVENLTEKVNALKDQRKKAEQQTNKSIPAKKKSTTTNKVRA